MLKVGQLANQERTTPLWFAPRFGPSTFAIFDAFSDESGRQQRPNAKALMSRADELHSEPPVIERADVLGAKVGQ